MFLFVLSARFLPVEITDVIIFLVSKFVDEAFHSCADSFNTISDEPKTGVCGVCVSSFCSSFILTLVSKEGDKETGLTVSYC